jgi:hypothetical protein
MNTHPLSDERISICNPSPSTSTGGNSCYRYCTVYVIYLKSKYRHYKNIQVTVNLTLHADTHFTVTMIVHYFEIILNKYTLHYSVKTFNVKMEKSNSYSTFPLCLGTTLIEIDVYSKLMNMHTACIIICCTIEIQFHMTFLMHHVILMFRSYLNLLTSDPIEVRDDEESNELQTAIENSLLTEQI